jgi:hypothetical protein
MKTSLGFAGLALTATAALAEPQVVQLVDDKAATITAADGMEVLSIGASGSAPVEMLSGATIAIVAVIDGPENQALFGAPLVVAEVTGTQSCAAGDPLDYYVVKLGLIPEDPFGPVTSCAPLTVTAADGVVMLMAAPDRPDAPSWT